MNFQMTVCPHVRHPKPAQQTSVSDFAHFDSFERLLLAKHAALWRQIPRFGRRAMVNFAASTTGGKVRRVCGNSVDRDAHDRFRRFIPFWREIVILAGTMDCGVGGGHLRWIRHIQRKFQGK